jgi:hypothetical protein
MAASLKELGHILQPKPARPETTPTLRELLVEPVKTVDAYYITPSLRALLKEVLETAVHKKGQGYWTRAEFGAGKTHFLATLTILLTNRQPEVWKVLHDDVLRQDYQAPLTKVKLFPITFGLLGAGEVDAGDSLVRLFEKEIRSALPEELRKKIPILSEELAAEWYSKQAGGLIKETIAAHFGKVHRCKPDEFQDREGTKHFGAEILKVIDQQGIKIDLKGSFRERLIYLYDRITKLGGYDGLVFVVDEFRAWQERHDGKPSFEEGVQFLETLAHYLPVEEKRNIITIIASQGDCPQKLMGAGGGDRFIVRELLKQPTDYGEIVCFRVRDVLAGKDLEIEDYFNHCREKFRFLRKTPRDYFRAIFPFQPACFDLLRRVTQSYERYGLPAARTGIHIAWETLRDDKLLASKRLAVLSDLLRSETLIKGLRSDNFKSSYESYETALEALQDLSFDDQERDLGRRILGTLYLWSVVNAETNRGMSIDDLAEATMADLEGLIPKDAVLDLLTRLKSDIAQIKYDKDKGARFEIAETGDTQPARAFGNFKKKAKADVDAQDRLWRESLFWDFKALEGAGSEDRFEGGFFDGYASRDSTKNIILPSTTTARTTPAGLHVQYGGEIIVADRWDSAFGEPWPNKPEVHFRIVYLTTPAAVNKAELLDPRIAVCVPGEFTEETRENLAEIVGCNLMLNHFNEKEYPGKGAFREWAKGRRREKMALVLASQIAEFRRGAIITQKELGLPASQFFASAPRQHGRREEDLAGKLLEKAYDAPLFNPKEFKKNLTENDARKVFHGLCGKTPTNADTSARENFAPGLGLVAKNDLATLAPQPGSAVIRIQERVRSAGDLAVGELVKELCQPPHGLTEDLIRLAMLCAVRAGGSPPLEVAELNPSAGLKLTNGKEPANKKLTGKQINLLEWNPRLEKALLGARLKVNTDRTINDALPYAQVIAPTMTPAGSPAEEEARNTELCVALQALAQELAETRENLKKLAGVLGGVLDADTLQTYQRLENIAATSDYLEFLETARANYATPEQFKAAHGLHERARRLTGRSVDLQSAKVYLDNLAALDDADLMFQAKSLNLQLAFGSLWAADDKVPALLEQFRQFRQKYAHTYKKAHRDHHEALEKLQHTVAGLDDKLTVIERLNALELGAPVGAALSATGETLRKATHPCALKINCQVDDKPRCGNCHWDGATAPPAEEVQQLTQQAEAAVKELCKRVAQEAIRKILEQAGQPNIHTLLEMITAARVEELARVLTPQMVQQLKDILAAANVEHRDLALGPLLDGFGVLEEDRIDDLLKQLRQQLLAAFDRAKRETDGKKRLRFLLK